MAKYIELNAGALAEKAAIASSVGAGDAGKIPALDAGGKLSNTMMPTGVGADSKTIVASEALAAGDLVNVFDDTSTPKVRKADASNGREANGYVLSAISASANGEVFFDGTIIGLSTLTIGAKYYLSGVTAGTITTTPPSTAGQIVQKVGKALSATELSFEPGETVTLA